MHVCACWEFACAQAIRFLLICACLSHVDGASVPHGDGAGSFSRDRSHALLAVAPRDIPGLILRAKFLPVAGMTYLLDSR